MEQSFLLFFYSSLFGYAAASLSPIRFKAWILSFSACLHLTSYVIRTFEAERLPLVGVFDTLSFLSLLIVLLALVFFRIYRSLTFLEGGAIMGTFLLLFDLFASRTLHPLPPVLNTLWFEVHVALTFVS
jgi:ABC-type transport system involved in cytochrome c biogenesis permease subunit